MEVAVVKMRSPTIVAQQGAHMLEALASKRG